MLIQVNAFRRGERLTPNIMRTLIVNKAIRRTVGGICVMAGGLLLWLAPDAVWLGMVLFAAGIALEIAGITLERRDSG